MVACQWRRWCDKSGTRFPDVAEDQRIAPFPRYCTIISKWSVNASIDACVMHVCIRGFQFTYSWIERKARLVINVCKCSIVSPPMILSIVLLIWTRGTCISWSRLLCRTGWPISSGGSFSSHFGWSTLPRSLHLSVGQHVAHALLEVDLGVRHTTLLTIDNCFRSVGHCF